MRVLDRALTALQPEPGSSFGDWGCGTGRATLALQERGFAATGIDIVASALETPVPFIEACLWDLPETVPAFDYGLCCDVMEHLPPEHVAEVLRQIASRTKVAVYFQIALFEDRSTGRAIVICALDNLGKGAAGRAVQNANLLLGFPVDEGLRLPGVLV